jgi:diguanylate cyclase (GGDEF)-like protein
LNRAERSNKLVALMFLDLDLFKTINDTFGHDAGDELLKSVAERLRGCLRKVDTIARLGGDEFTVILEGIEQIQDVAAIAQKILDVMAAPFLLEGQEVFVTTSIGVTIYPTDGKTADHLMRNADTAMYRAKENGRNNYQFYTEDMKVRLLRQLSLESCLRRAVEREEFVLYYQPQVDLHTGEIICVEALIRWQRRDEGGRLIAPGEFLPLAEETGLIVPIGEWVLRKACTQSKAWQKAGLSPLRVAVNLSAHQFKQRYLVERLSGILKDAELEPRYLGLELTEALLADAAHAQKAMEKLKDLGATIAIDDFGAGYFSLNYLKRLPIDALKIDRSFVSDVTSNPDDAAVAAAIIALAHALRIEVIAEGVETEAQVGFLRKHGCRGIQGYLLSRPMPAEEVAVWMKGMMQKQERFNVNANKEEKQNSGAIFKSEPLRATCEDFGSFW